MSKSYRLVDDGYPTYKKIVSGRKWIGRVCKIQNSYLGIIGKTEYKAPTEREAFDEVVARHCGYADAADMFSSNSQVRAVNKARKAEAQYVASEMLAGNFGPLDEMLGFKKGR
jgi:hypothetical protein